MNVNLLNPILLKNAIIFYIVEQNVRLLSGVLQIAFLPKGILLQVILLNVIALFKCWCLQHKLMHIEQYKIKTNSKKRRSYFHFFIFDKTF
jgi:hypothetical protein